MNDSISRADAIKAVANFIWHLPNEIYSNFNSFDFAEYIAKDALEALPSAEAVQGVVKHDDDRDTAEA